MNVVETFVIDAEDRYAACAQARAVPGVVLVRRAEEVRQGVWYVTVDLID